MFLIREALPEDLDDIHRLAEILNTVNLPPERQLLARVLGRSRATFRERTRDPGEQEYLFVLEDLERSRVVGASMIFAQHGTRAHPHLFFDVLVEERYSSTLGRHFRHRVLRLGQSYHGPTEIGGLILLPEYRGHAEQLGKQLSYVRFLFLAMHRDRFQSRVISELLPPLEADGRSVLWEHLGRKFTGIDYLEADRLSRQNKEFIQTLFPTSVIYASLFPQRVQQVIGRVGKDSQGVAKMLTRIGFHYTNRIDPFDGGPHYEADLRSIELVKDARRLPLRPGPVESGYVGMVARETKGKVRFRAVRTRFDRRDGRLEVPPEAARLLGARTNTEVWAVPFPGDRFRRRGAWSRRPTTRRP